MFWFKACPRCKGDLFMERDAYSQSLACLQCGWRVYTDRQSRFRRVSDAVEAENLTVDDYTKTTTDRELIPV